MRKTMLFLSLMLVLSLVLAACGGADQNNQGTQTVPTIGTTELPNTGLQGTETTGGLTATETTGLTGTETTGGLTATETPLALETSAPTVSTTQAPSVTTTQATGGLVTGTQTAVLPPTGMADPSRLTTLMTFDVRNSNGDVLGDVNNMIIDLGSHRILYVLVGSGGFLGIGEKQIPVPYEQLQINPVCIADLSGMSSTTSTTGSSGTGTSGTASVTGTETAVSGTSGTGSAGSATGTETAGTTGTGTTAQAGIDNCYFLLNVDQNVLKNAPNFNRDQLPDIHTSGWDAEFNQYWKQNGSSSTGTSGTGTSGTGSMTATETPIAVSGSSSGTGTSGTGSAIATKTPNAGTGSTSTTGANAQGNNRLILADELLGLKVVSGNAASTGSTTSGTGGTSGTGTSGTGSVTSTETAGMGATSTETAGAGTSGTIPAGEALGTLTDAIVELQSGFIRYYIVTGSAVMGAANGRLLPIPPQAFSFTGDTSSGNLRDVMLNVNNMVLSQAPAFDEGTFPNASIQGWDAGLSNFWSSQGFNSMTNP